MIKAVYIHIPFCDTICSYCDFCKNYYRYGQLNNYLQALDREIKKRYKGDAIETIYIGGGTPTCLNIAELQQLFGIIKQFNRQHLVEFTIECNIENLDEEKLRLLKENGVSRLSIGVQTFSDKLLSLLNRHHTKEEAINKINLAKRYFDNINVDLIYAIPGQTLTDLAHDLDILLALNVNHISTYSLIIEEHTILYNMGIKPIDEELDEAMYQLIINKLNNYDHYEISNFGEQCLHNLTYWHSQEYYGFGAGACGYVNSYRYENTKSISNYIDGNYEYEKYLLTKKDKIEEYFMLGLRLIKGVSKEDFYNRFKFDMKRLKPIEQLLRAKKLIEYKDYIYINPIYIYTSNDILVELIDI